jgi:ribosomal protein S10
MISYDHSQLDSAVKSIADLVKEHNSEIIGILPAKSTKEGKYVRIMTMIVNEKIIDKMMVFKVPDSIEVSITIVE